MALQGSCLLQTRPHTLLSPCGALAGRGEQGPESVGLGRGDPSCRGMQDLYPSRPNLQDPDQEERKAGRSLQPAPIPGGQAMCHLAAPCGASSTPCPPWSQQRPVSASEPAAPRVHLGASSAPCPPWSQQRLVSALEPAAPRVRLAMALLGMLRSPLGLAVARSGCGGSGDKCVLCGPVRMAPHVQPGQPPAQPVRAQQGPPLKCPCGGDASAATSSLAVQGMLKSTSELFLGQEKPG